MKRLFNIMLAVCAITLSACAQQKNKPANKENPNMKTTLVAYFSATGTTRAAAGKIAKKANADIYEIKPQQKYSSEDLDWTNEQSRSTKESKDKKARPAIVKDFKGAGQYNLIYLGFPIWWYTAPNIIYTFLDTYDLSGKRVVLFATSGGSTPEKALKDLQAAYPKVNFIGQQLVNDEARIDDLLDIAK